MHDNSQTNDKSRPGHHHNHELELPEKNAEIIPFPITDVDSEVVPKKDKHNWQTSLAYGISAATLGGIIAFPAINMIESENGLSFDIPGSVNIGSAAVTSVMLVSTAAYKYIKG